MCIAKKLGRSTSGMGNYPPLARPASRSALLLRAYAECKFRLGPRWAKFRTLLRGYDPDPTV
jgi:hypothetical protein